MADPKIQQLKDRKDKIAEITGKSKIQIQSVQMQLDILRKQGLLINLNISGTGMFTKTASFDEVGFARDGDKDARFSWIKPGTKFIIPEEPVRRLKSNESRMRQALDKYARKITGFHPWRWLPFTAYDEFKASWERVITEFKEIKAEIIANRDDYVDVVAEEYTRVAEAAWGSIKAQDEPVVIINGEAMDKEGFIAYIVAKAVSLVPPVELIESKLQADYVVAIVYGRQDVAEDEARAVAVREQIDLQRQMTSIDVSLAAEKARAEVWNIQAAQREREIKIEAMFQAEAEHAREQLQAIVSPFQEVFTAMRSQMAEDAKDILESIKKNGFVRGKVAERGRGLVDLFNLMCTHDDKELSEKLNALKEQLGPAGTKQDDESRSVKAIEKTLKEIMKLEKQAAQDLMAEPNRFSFVEV